MLINFNKSPDKFLMHLRGVEALDYFVKDGFVALHRMPIYPVAARVHLNRAISKSNHCDLSVSAYDQ